MPMSTFLHAKGTEHQTRPMTCFNYSTFAAIALKNDRKFNLLLSRNIILIDHLYNLFDQQIVFLHVLLEKYQKLTFEKYQFHRYVFYIEQVKETNKNKSCQEIMMNQYISTNNCLFLEGKFDALFFSFIISIPFICQYK